MQKPVAIFLLFIFSISVTEAGQLLKIPLLVDHYLSYNDQPEKSSLAAFLQEHYFSHHTDDGDQKDDEQLPFKSMNNVNVLLTFIPTAIQSFRADLEKPATVHTEYTAPFLLNNPISDIFHPPQQA